MQKFLKSWGLLIGAVLVGLLAFFAATRYLSDAEESLKRSLAGQGGGLVDVVVAAVDIPAGGSVSLENLAVAQVSSANLSGAVIIPDMFDDIDGSLLKVDMIGGEPLLGHFLEGVLIERFSELLSQGERAVTIEVDTLLSNAGLLSVGDHVDIFLSGTFPSQQNAGDSDAEALVPLFQYIKVLAVDRNPLLTREQPFRTQDFLSDEEQFDYSSVTLALAAGDADNLAFASSIGSIVFLLRAADDDKRESWEKLNQQSILDALGPEKSSSQYAFFGKTSSSGGALNPQVRDVLVINQQSDETSKKRRVIKSTLTSKGSTEPVSTPSVLPAPINSEASEVNSVDTESEAASIPVNEQVVDDPEETTLENNQQ